MRIAAWYVRVGDELVWELPNTKPALVIGRQENDNNTVTITYIDRRGKPDSYDYPTNELLQIVDTLPA